VNNISFRYKGNTRDMPETGVAAKLAKGKVGVA